MSQEVTRAEHRTARAIIKLMKILGFLCVLCFLGVIPFLLLHHPEA